jgi:putative Holliday junction resolvase
MKTNNPQVFIGLDVGERRIGVARVNTIAKIAEPLDLINTSDNDLIIQLTGLVDDNQADGIVVGLPRGLDGQETDQTQYCRNFANKLSGQLKSAIYLIDEAGTSRAADERMNGSTKYSRDSVAAAILLEDFVSCENKEDLRV